MAHPLQRKLAVLRARIRRLTAVYGASWVVGGLLAAVLLLGLADYLIRFEDRGLRILSTLGVLAVLGWTLVRYLYRPLTAGLRDVDLARRLQRRFPSLGDSLASAVEFLQQSENDPRAGSLALRRAVIARTTADTERIDFLAAIEHRPVRRAAFAAAGIGVLALAVVVASPLGARTALARLANPFGDTAWPQVTHLVVRNPVDRVARGQAFEVEVTDPDRDLPSQVRIYYRMENPSGSAPIESELMRPGKETMVARRENVQRSFSFRAEGGDDHSMPWHRVEVLEPPAIASLAVKLVPPAYTGWPEEQAEKNVQNLRALAGTRVQIAAQATKPLESAALCLEGGREIPSVLDEDRLAFRIGSNGQTPFVIEKSGAYWFRLTDEDGLTATSEPRWEIRAVADAAPTVVIEQPAGTVFVTPQAMVPVQVTAKDDLAIQRIELEYTRSDRTAKPEAKPEGGEAAGSWRKSESVSKLPPLFVGPKQPEAPGPGASAGAPGESRTVSYEWSLADLDLRPGTEITLRAVAGDYRPQVGKSEPRRLSIITPEELADRLAARQAALVAELSRVLDMQRQGRSQVMTIAAQAGQVERLAQREVDSLRGAELNQRQVNQALTSRTDGVPLHILGLLADLKNNKVDSPDVQRRMQAVLEEIDRLAAQELAVAGRELTAAIKAAQVALDAERFGPKPPPATAPAVAASLKTAETNQQQVILSLEQMLAELGRWDSFRRFHRDIGQLLREQKELGDRTAEIGRRTLTKEVKDLTPQDQADLAVAARQQFDLAQRLDRVELQMEQAVAPLRENDPLAAEAVSDALSRSRELAIAGRMRTARTSIEANQMGRAMGLQQQIVENLREILDILANRREHELARLVKRLQQAEVDLANLAKQQEGLRKQTQQAAAQANAEERRRELERLTARQQETQKKAEEMARRLERLTAQQAAQSTSQAAGQMSQAGQSGKQGDAAKAAQQAQQAEKSLQDAQQQLAQQRRQAESELAVEQLARLEDGLKSLHRRQERALEETRRLADAEKSQGRLTDAQESSLSDLGREQQLLQGETADFAEKLAGAAVFHLALTGAAREMSMAAALLDRRQTGDATQRAEQNALGRLAQLLEALQPDPGEKKDGNQGGGGQGGPKPKARPTGAGLQRMAELKLLKLMQQDVNRRTAELVQALGRGGTEADDARRQFAQLSQEQGRLADLLLQLVPPQQDPEQDPGNLPGPAPEENEKKENEP